MRPVLFISIDTEEDLWSEYRRENNHVENVFRIPLIQDLFDSYGAIPTYLINYPVVINHKAVNILKKIHEQGRCEIGTHLHPWNTPPFEEEINPHNTMLCNIPYQLQYEKIKKLHENIFKRMDVAPVSFRAGRWAFGSYTAKCIYELGYQIDTSITPFWNWKKNHGPDFSTALTHPYRLNCENITIVDPEGEILEIPPTIGFLQRKFERCDRIRKILSNRFFSRFKLIGVLDGIRLLNLRWLSPELSSGSDMIRLSRTFVRTGHQVLNMSFHSTTLLPGAGPYVSSDQELKKFLENIENFLRFAVKNRFIFSTLKSALKETPKNEPKL